MINVKTLNNSKQAHRTNILKTLEHRLEVAKSQGDVNLINQLEAEKKYYLK